MINFVYYIAPWRLAVASRGPWLSCLAVASWLSLLESLGCHRRCGRISYSLTALKLISRPLTEWVNAPTEMKSTPHSP